MELQNTINSESKKDIYNYFGVNSDEYIKNIFVFFENYINSGLQKPKSVTLIKRFILLFKRQLCQENQKEMELQNFKNIVLEKNQEAKRKAENYFNLLQNKNV